MRTDEPCPHPRYEVLTYSKIDPAHDICRCRECGAVGHKIPLFVDPASTHVG